MAKSKTPSPFAVKMTDDERAQFASDLCRDIDDAFSARASVIAAGGQIDLADWFYEQGRSRTDDRPFPGAADLTSYFITENVDALRARLMKAVFGVRPFCFVEGRGADTKKAPFVEELMDWHVRKTQELRTELGKTIHGALLEDCFVLEVSEKIETKKVTDELVAQIHTNDAGAPVFQDGGPKIATDDQGDPLPAETDETGTPMQAAAKVKRTVTKTKRLGPQYDAISMKEFVFLPGHAKSRKQVWGHAYRIWKRLPELNAQVEDGIYDEKAVKLLGTQSDRPEGDVPKPVDSIASQYGDATEKELFQVSLLRDLDGDGREEWYVATVSLKYRTLLRLSLDTFAQRVGMSRCVPFVLFPRRDSVYGYSYAYDKLLTLAEEHTALRNMKADRSALATNAPIQQVTGGLWDADAQPFGVGAIIRVRDHNELKQLQVQDVPASVIQSEAQLHQAKERVGGLSDSAVGILSGERRTLGENKLVAGGSAVRVDETLGYLHMAIADVMRLTHAILVDQAKADPKGMDAPQSVLDAVQSRTGEELQGGKFTVQQIDGDFQFEPYGSDETADPERKKSRFDGFVIALTKLAPAFPAMQQMMANPETTKAVMEQLLRAYDVRDRQPFLSALIPQPMPMGMPPGLPGMPPGAPPLPGALPLPPLPMGPH